MNDHRLQRRYIISYRRWSALSARGLECLLRKARRRYIISQNVENNCHICYFMETTCKTTKKIVPIGLLWCIACRHVNYSALEMFSCLLPLALLPGVVLMLDSMEKSFGYHWLAIAYGTEKQPWRIYEQLHKKNISYYNNNMECTFKNIIFFKVLRCILHLSHDTRFIYCMASAM